MRFSVCLPATRASTLTSAIASIRAQTMPDWELLVVGQGDADDVREAVAVWSFQDPRIRYLHIEERGASSARNAGLRAASCELVAMLDDDCEAEPDWLAVLAACLEDDATVGLVGGALVAPTPSRRGPGNCPSVVPSDVVYDPISDRGHAPDGWDWLSANVAMRRQLLEDIGYFDECLGPGTSFPSCDDTDLKLRFERAGVRMRTTPKAVVHHTYGWRYGVRAVLRHQRNYARGNGAMAAKLTLMGDRRGAKWLDEMRDDCLRRWYRRHDVVQLPAGLRRWRHFRRAYNECLRVHRVDERGLLVPAGARLETLSAAAVP